MERVVRGTFRTADSLSASSFGQRTAVHKLRWTADSCPKTALDSGRPVRGAPWRKYIFKSLSPTGSRGVWGSSPEKILKIWSSKTQFQACFYRLCHNWTADLSGRSNTLRDSGQAVRWCWRTADNRPRMALDSGHAVHVWLWTADNRPLMALDSGHAVQTCRGQRTANADRPPFHPLRCPTSSSIK